jgi:two-component system sensor histidine kinase ChiS
MTTETYAEEPVHRHRAKARFLLTLLAILLISGMAFYVVSVPRHRGEAETRGSVLDLSDADFVNMLYPLDGEWEFYFDHLYAPEDFANGTPQGGALISAPPSWTSAGYPQQGQATYRLILKTAGDAPLMLHIPEIMTASVVYVGGKKVYEAGRLDSSDTFQMALRSGFVSFTPRDGETEIIVQAARYLADGRGGLNYSLHVGSESLVLQDALLRFVSLAAVIGMMLMMALYHLVLFLLNRREIIYLWYVLYVLITALRMSMETNGLVQFLAPDGVTDMLFRIYMACFAGQVLFLILFTFEAFRIPYWPRKALWRVVYAAGGAIFAVNFLLYLSQPVAQSYLPSIPLAPLALVAAVAIRCLWVRREEYAGRFMGLYAVALLLVLVWGTLAKGLGDNTLFVPAVLSNVFMALTQAVVLAVGYADARRKVRDLAAETAFYRRMSHDLRTPLTRISTNIQIANKQQETDHGRLTRSQDEIMRMADMIDVALDDGSESGANT